MDIVLVYNPGAGDGDTDCGALAGRLEAAGHAVRSVHSDDPRRDQVLALPADLIAVCGGDGTVGRIAKGLAGRDIPIAAFAAGTANNIALTLGVDALPVDEQVLALPRSRRVRVDLAIADGPWGRERVIEGVGCGLFASSISHADRSLDGRRDLESEDRLARTLRILRERLGAMGTTRVNATLDGSDVSGDYLVFEAMNTRFVGPNLFLAPEADTGDGLLDVVMVRDDERALLHEHLAHWQRGALQPLPLPCSRGRALKLQWTGFDLHVDDRQWPPEDDRARDDAVIEIRVDGTAVEFLVP